MTRQSIALFLALLVVSPVSAADWEALAKQIESVADSTRHVYRLRDDGGRGMDCLEVFQPVRAGTEGYGVYHSRRNGVFSVHLAQSADLLKWTHVRELDKHASQPTIYETARGGYLLAYEKDAPNSCWIRVRFYKHLGKLCDGKFEKEFDLPRSLAPTAEGTPSFESVKMKGEDPGDSEIKLRFHYFENAVVDQLASGTLKNFKTWKAEPAKKLNAALKKKGGHGNLGDRARFEWNGVDYYLQEVQGKRGDWESWGIFLCDKTGMPLRKLKIATHAKATAFTNPNLCRFLDSDGRSKIAVSLFLPGEGSEPAESGQLLYVIEP